MTKKTVGVQMPKDLEEELKKLAENDGRNMSSYIRELIRKEIALAKITNDVKVDGE